MIEYVSLIIGTIVYINGCEGSGIESQPMTESSKEFQPMTESSKEFQPMTELSKEFQPMTESSKDNTKVLIRIINYGDIKVELYNNDSPITVKNFLYYVKNGFYDNTIFHRIIGNFIIQGGGFDTNMKQKDTNPPIKNESNNGLKNDKYTLSMARTNVPDSATSQFFINLNDNDFLDYPNIQKSGYAVFGKVIDGKKIIDKIATVETNYFKYLEDAPIDQVIIDKIIIES